MAPSAAMLAAFFLLLSMLDLASAWRGPKRTSPLLERQTVSTPPNVELSRIEYNLLLQRVLFEKPRLDRHSSMVESVVFQPDVHLPKGVEVVRDPLRSFRRDSHATASSELQQRDLSRHESIDPSQRTMLPYSAIGKLLIRQPGFSAECSGTLINDTALMTADHCLPWDTVKSKAWTTIEFIPAYNGASSNPRPSGSAFVTKCVGINPPLKDGRDVAVCKLNDAIGKKTGSLSVAYGKAGKENTFYMHGDDWSSVGSPDATDRGSEPAYEGDITITSMCVVNDGGITLSSPVYADHGWSGGPLFGWTNDCPPAFIKPSPYIGAVVSGIAGPSGAAPDATVHVGGLRVYALARYGQVDLGLKLVSVFPAWLHAPT